MLKENKKYILMTIVSVMIILCYLYIQIFGIPPKYDSGKTIEKALNVGYEKNHSNAGLSQILSTVDLPKDEKLVFYKSNENILCYGLVKRKSKDNWIVLSKGGSYQLDQTTASQYKDKLYWAWSNMQEFGLTVGVVEDSDIDKITVDEKNATIIDTPINKRVWYFIDRKASSSGRHEYSDNIKGYGKGNLIYTFPTQAKSL
ncbi:hypothetical protein [Clostridium manihotivorum]|uniref:Uncharacterized protein n=1 Tax=Clostridium manihotivorum TaxID=2320868 RepID=A0A3R5V7W8_9CLOT|nr:hypothetical protein [Clostridium manihotivorum]QAA32124.1 hypothetical protein C1I91_10925 [Clostridium manihotivorum]